MKLSIGILAWNEQRAIARTIDSLFAQTLFTSGQAPCECVEIVCVPNGCSDATAQIARDALAKKCSHRWSLPVAHRVEELETAGKANAWNEYVHSFSDQSVEFVVLMDADVQIDHPETLVNLIRSLQDHPQAIVSTALPLKHLALQSRRTIFQSMSVRLSSLVQRKGGAIAGALYCARGEWLRGAWLPIGVIGDDSFLKLLVVSDLFRGAAQPSRVVRAPNATVVFEANTGIKNILHHQRRRWMSHTINRTLHDYFSEHACPQGAGQAIKELNRTEPEWVGRLMRDRVRKCGWWVIPRGVLFSRFNYLKGLPRRSAVAVAPLLAAAFVVDVGVLLAANSAIKRGVQTGVWRRGQK